MYHPVAASARKDPRSRYYLLPSRSPVFSNDAGNSKSTEPLLAENEETVDLVSTSESFPFVVLDFGQELHGGVCVDVVQTAPNYFSKVRIRFGESVSEVMGIPSNDHAIHDVLLDMPCWGKQEFGNTGFRFVRLDLVEPNCSIKIRQINAVLLERPFEYKGGFECSDSLLNEIWNVGARTAHLCCQEYVLDGIKRDRLPWMGDIHPQVHVIANVFGEVDVVPQSLDYLRDATEPGVWMNAIGSYSLWWVISVWDWFFYTGNVEFLKQQKEALIELVDWLLGFVGDGSRKTLGESEFLDWGTEGQEEVVYESITALMVWAFNSAAYCFGKLGLSEMQEKSRDAAEKLSELPKKETASKHVNALRAISGISGPKESNLALSDAPYKGLSPWYGYYVLLARAKAEDYQGSIDLIRAYWGGMIELGATTFWEHFDIDWLKNAGRIDEVVPEGKHDVHAEYGDYCFKGLRHSLCHGWSAGPTAWMSEHILGVQAIEPGYKKVRIAPNLGDLAYAKGSVPTPFGSIKVSHVRNADNEIVTEVKVPEGVECV